MQQMLRRVSSTGLALLALTVGVALNAQAQSAEVAVQRFLEDRDRQIKAAVAKLDQNPAAKEHARSLVNDRIDFAQMGRLALGDYDADITDKQRADYVETFAAIVRAQSLSDLTVYNAAVTFDRVVVTGSKSHVYTRAAVDGKQVPVEYLLHKKADDWWLYDIILDGVGTVEGYAVSFQSVIRKHGFDRLMTSLEKRRARLEEDAGP